MRAAFAAVAEVGFEGLRLRRAGVPVAVFERDEHPASRWEGYRIHVDRAGARSLRACLPDHLWRAFPATAAPGDGVRGAGIAGIGARTPVTRCC